MKKIFLIHNPRTGGTFVLKNLRKLCPHSYKEFNPWGILNRDYNEEELLEVLDEEPENDEQVVVVQNHLPFVSEKAFKKAKEKGWFTVMFVRRPLDQLMSYYHRFDFKDTTPLDQFVLDIATKKRIFPGVNQLPSFHKEVDFVGICKNGSNDFDILFKKIFGFKSAYDIPANTSTNSGYKKERDDGKISDQSHNRLVALEEFRDCIDMYNYHVMPNATGSRAWLMHSQWPDWKSIDKTIHPDDAMYAWFKKYNEKDGFIKYATPARSAVDIIGRHISSKDKKILDYGCGHGRVTRFLPVCFPNKNTFVYDPAPTCEEFCCEQFGAQRFNKDIKDLDLVWSGSVLTHLDKHHWEKYFQVIYDSLRIGGKLITTFHGNKGINKFLKEKWFSAEFSEEQLNKAYRELDETGFCYLPYDEVYDKEWTWGLTIARSNFVLNEISKFRFQIIEVLNEGYANQTVFVLQKF